jgi:hypothetical protein
MEHIVIVFYFNLNNFQYSVCKICILCILLCSHQIAYVFLSCRATALQTAIECKLLSKLDVINTVHDCVCVCVCMHACVCARQNSCWRTLHFCVNVKCETVLSVSEQLSWKKVNSSKYSKVELTLWKCTGENCLFVYHLCLGGTCICECIGIIKEVVTSNVVWQWKWTI